MNTPNPATFLSADLANEQRLAVRAVKASIRGFTAVERKLFQNVLAGVAYSERRLGRRRTTKSDLIAIKTEAITRNAVNPTAWLKEIVLLRSYNMDNIFSGEQQTAPIAQFGALDAEMATRRAELARRRAVVMPKPQTAVQP